MRFCEKLKDARTKAGMKQEELAKALGGFPQDDHQL